MNTSKKMPQLFRSQYSKGFRALPHKALTIALTFILSALLTACGGSSSSDDGGGKTEPASVSGAVSLGPVYGATVSIYKTEGLDFSEPLAAQDSLLLGRTDTNDEGRFSQPNLGKYNGPVLLVVSVDNDSTYYDESTGSVLSFPGSGVFDNNTFFPDSDTGRHVLFALLPSPMDNIGITALTTAAARRAAADNPSTPLNAERIRQLNAAIREALAPQLHSILSQPSPFNSSTTTGSLGATESDEYALLLAALTDLAEGDVHPALAFLEALIRDLEDGSLDGGNTFYSSFTEFLTLWRTALEEFAQAYGNPDLQAAIDNYAPPSQAVNDDPQTDDDDENQGPNPNLTCEGLRNGEHDGFCGTFDGREIGYFTQLAIADADTSSDRISISFFAPNGEDGNINVGVPLNAGPDVSCASGEAKILASPPEDLTGSPALLAASDDDQFSHTDCNISVTRNGRVVELAIKGNLGQFKGISTSTVGLTNGALRITLPDTDESFRAAVDGTTYETSETVRLLSYRPGKKLHLTVYDTSTSGSTTGLWNLSIDNLSGNSGQLSCNETDGDVWLFYRDEQAEPEMIYRGDSGCTLNYSISNNTLTGSFSGSASRRPLNDPFGSSTSVRFNSGAFKVYLPDGPAGSN